MARNDSNWERLGAGTIQPIVSQTSAPFPWRNLAVLIIVSEFFSRRDFEMLLPSKSCCHSSGGPVNLPVERFKLT